MNKFSFLTLLFLISCQRTNYTQIAAPFVPNHKLDRFEGTIRGFEKQDSVQMPQMGGVLLAGSSSFLFWKTASQDLAPIPVINRAFGGSTLPEVAFYAERTILKYKPKIIVIYCENDMFVGQDKSPTQVRDAYVSLTQIIRDKLPKTQIYFVGLKPSPLRWKRWNETLETNNLIQKFIKTDKHHGYIDVSEVMLRGSKPDPTIFLSDSLHMNAEGYKRWTSVLRPVLLYQSGLQSK